MMAKHPDWYLKNRNVMSRLCMDYSNPSDWTANLLLENVDIVSQWNLGRAVAEQELKRCNGYK